MALISVEFLLFFSVFFIVYYLPLRSDARAQNAWLLAGSYLFYGFASPRLLPLIILPTLVFYFLGLAFNQIKNASRSSLISTTGVLLGLGLLIGFKYLNFIMDSLERLLDFMHLNASLPTFSLIMPIGISFFTFRLISYLIEIHRGRMEPTKDFVAFASYIAFFPTLLSGPIDRPHTFLPQLDKKRSFDYLLAVDGCRQILWGLFKKLVLADNLAVFTNQAWANIPGSTASTLLLAAIFYSFQMYTDFSGYSDIAIGTGKLLGFRITENFNYPFFATHVADFWRRWHISLTSWLTDYVFMPLNIRFRDWGKWGMILAIVINMILVGLWHGPNWTFAVFGLYHGLLFIPIILSGSFFKKKKQKTTKYGLPAFRDFTRMVGTFMLVTIGLVIFRAPNMEEAITYFKGLFSFSLFSVPEFTEMGRVLSTGILLAAFIVLEWIERDKPYPMALLEFKYKRPVRWALYAFLVFLIGLFMRTVEAPFIYIQF